MADDMKLLVGLSALKYHEQAKWFLNAYWDRFAEAAAESVWGFAHKFIELDEKSGKDGCELSELVAHRFLEQVSQTLTVRELRDALREIDIDTNKSVSLTEYLIYKYKVDWHELVNAAQSDNKEEVDEAQRLLEQAVAAVAAAQDAQQEARQKENTAHAAEREVRATEATVTQTLAEVDAQQAAVDERRADIVGRTESGGMVSRNKAKHELASFDNEDHLPLTRAKISQEAAVRAARKATAEAEAATKASIDARAASDAATEMAVSDLQTAEDFLNEVKSKPGSGKGLVWWLEREIVEAKKYLPQSKGGGQ